MRDAGAPIGETEDYELKRRFRPVRFNKIKLSTERPYLVKGLLPREGLAVVWGPPKCGKSFWVFDLALHVALDWEYRGRRTQQGTVCYVACEGERGLGARAEAFRIAKLGEQEDDLPFYLLATRLDLVADAEELIADIRAAISAVTCPMIVIDTLNRSIAGSESRDEDMSAYVKAADRVREALRATVVIIHHCGINGERPRGHTSLTGAADAQIAVRRDDSGRIAAKVEWMKDGAEGDEIASRLKVVEVNIDEDGEPIISCVVEPAEGTATPKAARLSAAQGRALQLLADAIDTGGEIPPASNHIPQGARCVDEEVWRKYCYQGAISAGDQHAKRMAFKRSAEALMAAGRIGKWEPWVWLA
jgi:KaiC/GvpD/RAD55 family RecA-like ATPase